ncbi:MAG: 2-C-methyl-D-erythritol 2,4-cyclodiphosphate synthase [Actinobacteria bacterium]|nr:2-C-methyl-D-erythritol 2,4-cyclodiphosphate synthase [Actinomycetota bacterium]
MNSSNNINDHIIVAVLLCGGKSVRMGGVDKTSLELGRDPVFIKSLKKLLACMHINKVLIVASRENENLIKKYVKSYDYDADVILGGERRQDSVRNAINYLRDEAIDFVVIHDGGRPFFSQNILESGLKYLSEKKAVIPVIPISDTVKKVSQEKVELTIKRDGLFRSQTPQFFDFKLLSKFVTSVAESESYTDEAQLFENNNQSVFVIPGELRNEKISNRDDFELLKTYYENMEKNNFRTGIAADTHKLVLGRDLILGGVHIPNEKGLDGHSDADVILHAIADSILGACGAGDLGVYFPSSDSKWKDKSSKLFLDQALNCMINQNLRLEFLDLQIILETPKISNHREKIEKSISNLLNLDIESINFKVTSTDGLGIVGKGDGIGALCVVTLRKHGNANL